MIFADVGFDQHLGNLAGPQAAKGAAGTEHQIADPANINDGPAVAGAVDQTFEFGNQRDASPAVIADIFIAARIWTLSR